MVTERAAMLRAIDLAWRGWGQVHPNPMVGAVVLADGAIVGEGYHAVFGERHAERIALEQAGPEARGSTLVVTLEPCSHEGKQPPCVDAVIEAGVSRVVMALADPNPQAAGGAHRLAQAGVEVDTGLLAPEACRQNAGFLHRFRRPERPWLALKLATSIDHRIADGSGNAKWVSGPEAGEYVHGLRAGFDAIAVGAGTVRADDPRLTVRGATRARIAPTRVVFTRSGNIPRNASVIATAGEVPTWLVSVGPGHPPPPEPAGSGVAGVTLVRAPTLEQAMAELRSAGITTMLVEGGGGLAGALLEAGLVDRFYWVQSPLWLGTDGVPATRALTGGPLAEAERWTVIERRSLGQDTLLVMDRKPCLPD
ncbi:MAG: bifunctional diaminohydroxyphosphoribosylaminopyrimidine deaminase/5-amino-6-(5-phosphoribosylamino)uracil reductase RibD [Gemmatimonadetes bacterium]|nr:bifunctional diaminohydroxyphosphoribosylaminopyrimidine deaminase/5-amino-6-(5-phosphoribosylamino)uracil reductase RibD [Gemmatimonadota bacterium]